MPTFRDMYIFIGGVHFTLFVFYLLVYIRNVNSKENNLNITYSVFNLTYFLVNILNKVYFQHVMPLILTTTLFLVCSSAYLGYTFLNLRKYRIPIFGIFSIVCVMWFSAVTSFLPVKLFFISAAIFALFYSIILTIEFFIKFNQPNKIIRIGFIFLYISFVFGGVRQGTGGDLTATFLVLAKTAPMFVLIIFCLYFAFQIYQQNKNIEKSKEELLLLNNTLELQVANQTAELRNANQQLALEKEYKANLLVNAAHELRTPHAVLKSNLHLLKILYPEMKRSSHFASFEREMERVITDTTNILDESRFDMGKTVYNHEKVYSLSDQIRDKAMLFKEYAQEGKGINVDFQVAGGLDIRASDEAVNRIVNNIFENAVKFSPEMSLIEIILKNDNDVNRLSVRDRGPGIPSEELEYIFNEHYQVTRAKEVSNGIGLGLFLVKKIINEIGGEITIDSIVGEGTVVELCFPNYCKQANEVSSDYTTEISKKMSGLEVEIGDSEQRADRQTILIVEDESELLKSVKQVLQDDYNILTASNGERALDRLKENIPDLIIADIMMPIVNGIELCNRVGKMDKHNHIPFIFLTSKAAEGDILKGFEAGAIDYITKPFDFNLVKIRVANNIRIIKLLTENVKLNVSRYFYNDRKIKYLKHDITSKQQQYIDLLLDYSTEYSEIAEKMNVSLSGVKSAIRKVGQKIGCIGKKEIIDYFS